MFMRKNQGVVVVLLAMILVAPLCSLAQGTLEVTVTNIKSAKGTIRVGLFTEKDFLKTAIEGRIVDASKAGVTVLFENVKPGTYGLSIIHDENGNGELDSNKLGVPKEGFGFGNNALGTFGPPPFEKAKIEIGDQPVKQKIELKYF